MPVVETAFDNPPTGARTNETPKTPGTLFGSPNAEPAPKQTAALEPSLAPTPPAASSPPANSIPAIKQPPEPLTWRTARVRLQALGIERYYLEPDPAGQQFLFRCTYSPSGNPRISRRFEAEAAEPLEAVRKVLEQVESWTARN